MRLLVLSIQLGNQNALDVVHCLAPLAVALWEELGTVWRDADQGLVG